MHEVWPQSQKPGPHDLKDPEAHTGRWEGDPGSWSLPLDDQVALQRHAQVYAVDPVDLLRRSDEAVTIFAELRRLPAKDEGSKTESSGGVDQEATAHSQLPERGCLPGQDKARAKQVHNFRKSYAQEGPHVQVLKAGAAQSGPNNEDT